MVTSSPAGTGPAERSAMTAGNIRDKTWTVRLTALPNDIGPDDIEEIYLLLSYEPTA